ncbi:MAG: PAS domain S-box protein [Chloroflexi bacterium]|nr:PAS domain S-box protein [Chloroflexota bacterium]
MTTMPFQLTSLFFIAITVLAVWITFLLRRKASASIGSIFMLTTVVAVWAAAYLLHVINERVITADLLQSINYLCLTSAASGQLLFAFSYTNRTRWLTPITYFFLLLEPTLTQALFWVEPSQSVLFDPQTRIWEQVNIIYNSHLLAASVFLLVDTFLNKPSLLFLRAWTIPIGAILPLAGNMLIFILRGETEDHIYLAFFSYALAIAGFSYGKFNSNLVEITPLTRDIVVESMDDGWMVVDDQDKIIDMNAAVERMIGASREKLYGMPVNHLLSDWPKVQQSSEGIREMEMRRPVKTQGGWQYLNIRISQLTGGKNSQFGHLFVWRDVTGRKLADDARQRARDELFVLLNAISSLASRSMNLEDFLSESSYQVIYSFNSQAVAVFLTEEKDGTRQGLSLKSHFGFSPEHVNTINRKTVASNLHEWLISNEESRPLILDGRNEDGNPPLGPAAIGFNYVALIPLVIYTEHENNILGCLCLGRNKDAAYSQDEVIRLTTIANQIATLIDSNRRRQFAIALGERQRLLRDLHDSVSQKLYGLLALTEAAQAGIEAGSTIAPLDVLTRIGENARQAVKEMRLFLYEMQPTDLKDGLVPSLQHRIAAVEGRADIRARMISDENIQLDKESEIALYYIAQEALNNILRHAHARNVSVSVKQTRKNVILEIVDDGQGFDIKKLDDSGLGLRSMRERAAQVNGKFKITSKPGAGTKVLVSVARKG